MKSFSRRTILTDEDFGRLPDFSLEELYQDLCDRLDATAFKLLSPGYNSHQSRISFGSSFKRNQTLSTQDEYVQNILFGTAYANGELGNRPKIDLKILNRKFIIEIEDLLACHRIIMDKYKMELLSDAEMKPTDLPQIEDIDEDEKEDDRYVAPPDVDDEKVLITMQSPLFADMIKLHDKYSIRIGDGKYFVASDEIKVVLRDPSTRPSWAIWFLSAVPLEKIPSRAALLLMPEEERQKIYPEQIPDQLIVCHATLWKAGNKTMVLLHTSWNHIAATYRWVIDKPIDVASVLFKAVSHPAHLARNFGYTPNLAIPGDNWIV